MPKTIVRYSKSIGVIHWVSAIAVLGAWLSAEGGRKIVQDPPILHFTLGLAVLALVLPRLILRLAGIYGPQRSTFDRLRDGTARRIVKPGQVAVGEATYDLPGLTALLREAHGRYEDQGVVIRGDSKLSYQDLADVLSTCDAAGIHNVRLPVRPRGESPATKPTAKPNTATAE